MPAAIPPQVLDSNSRFVLYCHSRWGVAKSVRHGTLTPAFVGSSPAAPTSFINRMKRRKALFF